MTREEAIKALRDVQCEVMRDSYIDKVYDMAIEALSQVPSDDVISRRKAILQLSHNKCGNEEWDIAVQHDIETITQLPSAQPDFDITVKIDKAYDDGYEAGYLQGRHDWGDLDE